MEHTHTHTIYVKTNSAKIYRLSQGILFVHYPPDLILNHYPLSRLSVTCHSSPVQTTQYILHMCVCVCGCQDFPITAWQPASSICICGYIYFSALSHFCTASSCQTLYQISAHSDRCAVDMHAHMQKALSTLCMTEHAGVKEAPPQPHTIAIPHLFCRCQARQTRLSADMGRAGAGYAALYGG